MKRPTAWERAFQLARSGAHDDCYGIRAALRAEGYGAAAIAGRKLIYELTRECMRARSRSQSAA